MQVKPSEKEIVLDKILWQDSVFMILGLYRGAKIGFKG